MRSLGLNKMLKKNKILTVFILFSFLDVVPVFAQLEETANTKITELKNLIAQAETKGIDVLKEEATIRTAEVFLKYANWDEENVATNTEYFSLVHIYKDNAAQMAEDLPDFERNEIILMLDEAILNITKLINGEVTRKASPKIDWSQVSISGNKIMFQGKPVFLEDYTWKPRIEELTEFYGNKDGVFITPTDVTNSSGAIKGDLIAEIQGKTDNVAFGSIFLNHKNVPDWAETTYGPGFKMREDTFTAYDIDNPGARELQSHLLGATVPLMAGKKYTELGYMLVNEPHFITTKDGTKDVWASGPVSNYTIDKFKIWLENKHTSISELNMLWETSFASFNEVTIEIPIEISLRGTPMWYDWQLFNMNRVTEWYSFLRSKIQEHDPLAKTHLKLIPKMWSGNGRDHGLDFEALTMQSEIIGNDAGSHNSYMWGSVEEWESRYNFEWRELAMSYDFFKSISPNKINYNSEGHFLSTTKFRDLYQKPSYARMTYWLAHIHGLNVIQTWFWSRREDGSIRNNSGKSYAGSNNQQPRIVNEVASTMLDINAFAEEFTALQNMRKPIRIFHSKTSALNKTNHMDDVFELYEELYFNGLSLGFATENIITQQNNSLWDVIVVNNTQYVTLSELNSLQQYLDNGGTVILDSESLKMDEYGRNHNVYLNTNNGGVLISNSSVSSMANSALDVVESKGGMPKISVAETNSLGKKGVSWRVVAVNGKNIISLVNIGKETATVTLGLNGSSTIGLTNLLTGENLSRTFEMEPEKVYLLEAVDATLSVEEFDIEAVNEACPDEDNGKIKISAVNTNNYTLNFNGTEVNFTNDAALENLAPGFYEFCITNNSTNLEQCYNLKIDEATSIAGKTEAFSSRIFVNIEQGTAPFEVVVNNETVLNTNSKSFSVATNKGDLVKIKSSIDCEGELIQSTITAYPNPTTGVVQISVNSEKKNISVEIYNSQSQILVKESKIINNGVLQFNIEAYPSGLYFVKLQLENEESVNLKVMKL
ncbi:beta-galactosidase [Lutibacter oricola]|uniref:Beta-galactosidase n=1 Tax=Lutibacter oricola TaxID=762486 RepID=A0A1H2SV40_9FLAO|nr:T9SS type A sorting domain-containing protein [Lutibacter oricola]SDW35531.1 beta-galactosidase [Lutibacter oricola]